MREREEDPNAKWFLHLKGDFEVLKTINQATWNDNKGFVEVMLENNLLKASSTKTPLSAAMRSLQDYLSHLKLSLKIYSLLPR